MTENKLPMKDIPNPSYEGESGWPWTAEPGPLDYTMDSGRPWPKISIVTPSFNQGEFLAETIESVITQQGDFYIDYIIMDGGSCDQSMEIIKKYKQLLLDNCDVRNINGLNYFISSDSNFLYNQCAGISFHWVSEKDEGQTDAINKGFKVAHGDVLAWLNSDDIYYPFAFKKAVNINWKLYDFCYGKGLWVSKDGEDLCLYPTIRVNKYSLYNRCTICQPTVFFRRDVYKRLGDLDLSYYCSFDYEYWLRAVFSGCRFYYMNSPIAKSRMYAKNKSLSSVETVRNERQRLRKKYYEGRQFEKAKFWYYSFLVEDITTCRENRLLMELHKPDKEILGTDSVKVFYDISVLARGHSIERARTGIFRVIENIALGLSNSEECQLTLHFNRDNDFQCFEYLKSNTLLEKYTHAPARIFSLYFNSHFHSLNTVVEQTNSPFLKKLMKVFKRFISLGKKIYIGIDSSSINKNVLDDIDIYHSSFYPVPKQLRTRRGIKIFLTVYDLIPILYPQFFQDNEDHLIRKVIRSITRDDFVLCISESTRNDLCDYSPYVDPDKVFVTHLAASDVFQKHSDPEIITAIRNKYNIPVHSPYILSVCTLEPRKNIDHTIRCFVKLIKEQKIRDLHLVLTGTMGWDYDKMFNELSSTPGMKDKIILTGYVPDEDLSVLYSDALVFVYPSFYEGFGLPPLEAMKCGAPVITSNTSSLPEVVGNAGITLDPKDSDGLTQSLMDLYSKSSLRREMSIKSIEQAQKFSWEKCISETIAAYKKARG